ncbi:MAG TPA: EpsI family protein [Candidatus Acidoferrales bacterium]|jgi:EpsI family protein
MSLPRFIATGCVLVVGIFASHNIKPAAASGGHRPLREFPATIDSWRSEELPFDSEIVDEIGVDDYTNREYFGGARPVELYIGYYKDQRSGDAIHSPKNCLPGEGWEPVRSSRIQIGSAENPAIVNEYFVEKGRSRDLVLYWYQTRGRIVASEYWAKFWLVADGVRNRRTDGAMVRIWTTAADGDENAEKRATIFAQRVYPQVSEYLPN